MSYASGMPLAHILAPQIEAKVKQIEAALGPPRAAGYLQTQAPPNPVQNTDGGYTVDFGPELERMGARTPGEQKDARNARTRPSPMAPAPLPAPAPPPVAPVRPGVITAPRGVPVGVNERGESLDIGGKNLGYLNQPSVVGPQGTYTQLRTGERNRDDVLLYQRDQLANDVLDKDYGAHLKALEGAGVAGMPEAWFNAEKDDVKAETKRLRKELLPKFPAGYFDGKTPDEVNRALRGTKELLRRRMAPMV